MKHVTIALFAAGLLSTPLASQGGYQTLTGNRPIVIGHRGASGYLPEHTLEGYKLAIQQGADFIEPDLVMTKDGFFIARHEPMLGSTTDVASKFDVSRKSTRLLDGVAVTDYFASDFTLAEIKTLRAIQPNAGRSQAFNGLYEIPTLSEIINLVQTEGAALGRVVGIYPEVKHSTFHAGLFGAHSSEDNLILQLHTAFGNTSNAPVFIQSFEVSNLQYLNSVTEMAHAAGLLVHAFTFRNDASGYGFSDPKEEMAYYFSLGLDGLFTDFPDTGVEAVNSVSVVPEPATLVLITVGLVLLGCVSYRRNSRTNRFLA